MNRSPNMRRRLLQAVGLSCLLTFGGLLIGVEDHRGDFVYLTPLFRGSSGGPYGEWAHTVGWYEVDNGEPITFRATTSDEWLLHSRASAQASRSGLPLQFTRYARFRRGFPAVWFTYLLDTLSGDDRTGVHENSLRGSRQEWDVYPRFVYEGVHVGVLLGTLVGYAAVLFCLLSTLARFRRWRRVRRGCCPGCGYDLTANTSNVCSECGLAIGPNVTAVLQKRADAGFCHTCNRRLDRAESASSPRVVARRRRPERVVSWRSRRRLVQAVLVGVVLTFVGVCAGAHGERGFSFGLFYLMPNFDTCSGPGPSIAYVEQPTGELRRIEEWDEDGKMDLYRRELRSAREDGLMVQSTHYLSCRRGLPWPWLSYLEGRFGADERGNMQNAGPHSKPVSFPRHMRVDIDWPMLLASLCAWVVAGVVLMNIPAHILRRRRESWRLRHGRCHRCGFDLRLSDENTCSQCGTPIQPRARAVLERDRPEGRCPECGQGVPS